MTSGKIGFNLSREAILMNDLAFPDTAINTVGFRLDLVKCDADTLMSALERVIAKTDLFHYKFCEENGVRYMVSDEAGLSHVTKHQVMTIDDVDEVWENEIVTPCEYLSWKAEVFGFIDGGSAMIMLFHHTLVDGYTGMQLAQLVLNEIDGIDTDEAVINYSGTISDSDNPLTKEELEAHKTFWLNYFEGFEAEYSFLGGDADTCDRNRMCFRISDELNEKLLAFEKENGVKDSAVFGAAFSIWLSRAGRTKDAVFLMPRLNRDTKELLSVVGCRTLLVPVRNTIDGEDSFIDLCRQSADSAKKASAHKQYGMKKILEDLQASGMVGGVLSEYVLNCTHVGRLHSNHPYEIYESMAGGMNNHLTVCVQRYSDRIDITYDARVGIYDDKAVSRFHEALIAIIKQGIVDNKKIDDILVVGEEECEELLNMKGKEYEIDDTATIPSLLRDSVKRYGDRPALYAGERTFTYNELDRVSNRIAHGLIDIGVYQGEPVLYMLKRDYRLIPAMFGISKSGAAFIPIDPAYPQKRIDYIISDSGAKKMIVSDETKPDKEDYEIELINIDELLDNDNDSDPELDISQQQMAYSIYTSGTTGNPKGVMLSHRGIVNFTNPDNNPFNRDIVKNGKGIVAIGSVCFDISLSEMLLTLYNGSFIEFAPEDSLADPRELSILIEKHKANLLHCTPSRILAYLRNESFKKALGNVDAILSAGESLPGTLVTELKENYGIRIYNGYGPTETTIGATVAEAGDDVSIGCPIANTGILLLDDKNRLMPYGTLGEICIYGMGVGIGYHNLAKETNNKFVNIYGRRVYRSGDIGRFLPDGRIEYHGRNDFQVKIRGLRIELSEIENCMLSYDGVSAACAKVRRIQGREHLVGFYTVSPGQTVVPEKLTKYLREHLTLYMVPDILKEIDDIPRTPGGKVDLKQLEQIPVNYVSSYREPENEYQKIVCEVFEKVLELEKVGIDDNFFEIGGDSLHTADLIHEIGEKLTEVNLKFGDIFKYPTPELLSQYLYRVMAEVEETTDKERKYEKIVYDDIDKLLLGNVITAKEEVVESRKLGNVLLTGATGFLGLHILMEILKEPDSYDNIFCLIRPTKRLSPEKRLKNLLFYFENESFAELIGKKIFAVSGDISKPLIFDDPLDVSFNTVINCAADVSHFAYDDKLDRINTGGVRNLLGQCKKDSMFIQISTISVGGIYKRGSKPLTLTEQKLYIGQEIDNQYMLSKFMAEYEALNAMAKHSVNTKIMRIGNLQGRLSDGEFQLNKNTNAFTRQISSYIRIGKVPESIYKASVNFSPVDEVARMIVHLTMLSEKYSVFHVSPDEEVSFKQLFDAAAGIGHSVEVVSDDEFEKLIQELIKDKAGRKLAEGILAERPDIDYRFTDVSQQFTSTLIDKLDLKWGKITDEYLDNYLRVLDEFGMFEGGV